MKPLLFPILLCCSFTLSAQNISFVSTGQTDSSACLGQQTTFFGSSIYPDTSIAGWFWDFDDDGQYDDGIGKSIANLFVGEGKYPVGLKVVLKNSLADSMAVPDTVTVNPLPQVNFTVENMCEGQTAVFSNNSIISSGFIGQLYWDFKNDGTENDSGMVVTFNCGPAETYQTKLRCISDKGCESFAVKTTQVFHQPQAGFTVQSACLGGTTSFTNTSSIQNENISFYIWDFGDGDSSVLANPTHVYNSEMSYLVKLTAVSENSCKSTDTTSVTIAQLINADFSFQNTCLGGTTQFINNSTAMQGEVVSSFQWEFGDGSTGTSSGNVSHEFVAQGNYNVTLTAISQNSCKDVITLPLNISSMVSAGFSSQNACLGEETIFTNNSTASAGEIISSLIWDFGDGSSATSSGNVSHNYPATGTYNISLISITQNSCKDTVSAVVYVYQLPIVSLAISGDTINDSTLYEGNKITLEVAGNAGTYLWNNNATTATITIMAGGIYSVTATNSNGCSQTLSKRITVKEIPDTVAAGNDLITPNGDGINDVFIINDLSGYKECSLNVYNLWNEEVFSSSGYKNEWDGKNKNGKNLDAGAYYYILKCDEKKPVLGTVNVLR